jgi:predicted nicotinamide N-methyase
MDYFKRHGLPPGTRVMEIGCGWGLAGIYCAKQHGAIVTGVDIDPAVFPYLQLHATINKVAIATLQKRFNKLGKKHLKEIDVVIGGDICFWDNMVNPIKKLINRALRAGVNLIIIADPGRSPFVQMSNYFVKQGRGMVLDWAVHSPQGIQGKLLRLIQGGAQHEDTCRY